MYDNLEGNKMALTLEGERVRCDLEEQGLTTIEHGIPQDMVDEANDLYGQFTTEFPDPEPELFIRMMVGAYALERGIEMPNPQDVDPALLNPDRLDFSQDNDKKTEWHKKRTTIMDALTPLGYSNKAYHKRVFRDFFGYETGDDLKEFVHVVPNTLGKINIQHQEHEWGPLPDLASKMILSFARLHHQTFKTAVKILSLMGETEPTLSEIIKKLDPNESPMRGLYYHETPETASQPDVPYEEMPLLGRIHIDKGALITVQIAETHVGFEGKNPNTGKFQVVRRSPDLAVAFVQQGFDQFVPNTKLRALPHRVRLSRDFNQGRRLPLLGNFTRVTNVMFLDHKSTELKVDDDALHPAA